MILGFTSNDYKRSSNEHSSIQHFLEKRLITFFTMVPSKVICSIGGYPKF